MNKNIRIDFYESDGDQIIRIDVDHAIDLVRIADLMRSLAAIEVTGIDLINELDAYAPGTDYISMEVFDGPEHSFKTVYQVKSRGPRPKFRWIRSTEGWLQCSEKVDIMVYSTRPCHQYLAGGPVDDAVIVIAFRESYTPPIV